MAGCTCCVCIGGVNYTKACSACNCNSLSMSTVHPNPSVNQAVCKCGGCGGASSLSSALNAIGKWGTAITGLAQGKPVATSKTGVAVGAKGATTLGGAISSNTLILILVVVGALIFLAMRK